MLKTSLLNRTAGTLSRTYAGLALSMDVHRHAPLPAGAKIIAANHPTTTDPFLMMGLTGEPLYILITNMCFEMPFLGGFLRRAGHIPVAAGNGRAAFEAAVELLKEGKTVGIFPEGANLTFKRGHIKKAVSWRHFRKQNRKSQGATSWDSGYARSSQKATSAKP